MAETYSRQGGTCLYHCFNFSLMFITLHLKYVPTELVKSAIKVLWDLLVYLTPSCSSLLTLMPRRPLTRGGASHSSLVMLMYFVYLPSTCPSRTSCGFLCNQTWPLQPGLLHPINVKASTLQESPPKRRLPRRCTKAFVLQTASHGFVASYNGLPLCGGAITEADVFHKRKAWVASNWLLNFVTSATPKQVRTCHR